MRPTVSGDGARVARDTTILTKKSINTDHYYVSFDSGSGGKTTTYLGRDVMHRRKAELSGGVFATARQSAEQELTQRGPRSGYLLLDI